jgi:hypothetical protein
MGTTTLNAASTVDYAAVSGNQTVSSGLTYGTLYISGGMTKTLAANLPALNSSAATAGNIIVAAGTFDLSSFTANRGTTIAGGSFTIANGATLKIGGIRTFPANFASHTLGLSSTVVYSGGNQSVTLENYGNLILTSSGGATVKTLPSGALTIGGDFMGTLGSGTSLSFAAAGAITVRGNVTIGSSVTFTGGTFAHNFDGNWANDGTYAGATGSVTLTGAGTTISGSGANNFNNLTISGSGIAANANTSLNVAGDFLTSGAGSFSHGTGGAGTVNLTGVGKTLNGNGISFNHLAVSGSLGTASAFRINGNLTVTGSLIASNGMMTMAGIGNTITGPGVISLFRLNVPGNITTPSDFSVGGDLSVSGSFTATAGTVTFNGNSILSGSARLFSVTLAGTKLQLGAGSILGVAANLIRTSGTLDVSTTVPNTVDYDGSAAQTVLAVAYNNLSLSGGGTKTAAASLTINGDLLIAPGAAFAAGSFTHSIAGNWTNLGTFAGPGGTIQLVGGQNTSITGATTFDTLAVAKSSPASVVSLHDSAGASTVNMVNGTVLTGTNALTITADRTGGGIILGTIVRLHPFLPGVPYAFEGSNNTITFSALTAVSSVTVTVSPGVVLGFPFGSAINRQYTIDLNSSGPYTAALRLHYEEGELNGNNESAMQLWRDQNPWVISGKTAADPANNWVEQSGLNDLQGEWTLSDNANVVRWNGSVSGAWENAANWTAVQGSPHMPPSTNDIVQLGDGPFGNQPMIGSPVQARAISFGSAQAVNLTLLSGGSLDVGGNGGDITGTWTNDRTHSINVGAQRLAVGGAFRLSDGTNGHAVNLNVGAGAVMVAGDLVQSGSANIIFTGGGTLQIGGNFGYSSGMFAPGGSTVTYNGAAAQAVAGGISYHNLSFDKTAGTATLAGSVDVGGHFTVTNAGSVSVNAALNIASNVVVYPGATLDGNSAMLTVGGDWTITGNFIPASSTVVFNGGGDQSVSATTFNNITIDKPSSTVALAGNVVLNGDMDVIQGTLNLAGFTANRSSLGGAFTLASGCTLQIGTGSSFPLNFATRSIADTSTVEYFGTGPQVVTENAYGNLTLSNGGGNAKTIAGTTTIAANLLINAGATLNAGAFQLNVAGNWINNGAFVPASSSVVLSGVLRTISGATLFNNLTVSGSYSCMDNISVSGAMTVSGTYLAGGTMQTFFGDFNDSGSFISAGVVTFAGTVPQLLDLNAGFSSSGTLNFDGTTAPTFTGISAPILQNVNINNFGGVAPSTGWVITGDFMIASGAGFAGGPMTHVFNGSFLNDGGVSSSGTLIFGPTSAATIRLKGSSFLASGTVLFGGSAQITLQGGTEAFGSVAVTNSHPAGLTPDGNWTLAGDLFVAAGASLNGGSGLHHTIAGNWSDDGIFNGQTSTVELNGTTDIAGAGATTFNDLIVTGTAAAAGDFGVARDFTNNGTFDAAGSTITFVSAAPSIIGGSATPTPFDSLAVAKNGAPVTLAINIAGLNTLAVASGTLDVAAFTISQDPLGGTLTIGAGALLRIGGANTLPVFDNYDFDPASTVEYYGNGNQVIAGQNYGNLRSSSNGARVLSSTGVIGIAGSFAPGANSYTINGSTMRFNGSGTQTIPAFNYYNLASSSSGARILDPVGNIGIAGTFAPGTNLYTTVGSTLDFNGAAQTIPGFAYNNLSVSGSGTKSLGGDSMAAGNFKLLAGTLADVGHTLAVSGNITNGALHSGSGKILLTGGSASHQLSGAGSFGNLELNDSNGASLTSNNLNVGGTLALTSGLILTGTNRVIIALAGNVTRIAGHVAGFLQKTAPTGAASLTFEVGDLSAYAPVAVNFGAVTASGSLAASTTAGDHPQIGGSGILGARSVNRFWTLSNSGIVFNNYNATLTFNSSDLDPGANPANFIVALKTSTTWVLPAVGAKSATSIQATGLTAFGQFIVGESAAPGLFTGIRILPSGNPALTLSGSPGQTYRIQAATNLALPISWMELSTNTAGLDGLILFEDVQGTSFPMRFYRSITP